MKENQKVNAVRFDRVEIAEIAAQSNRNNQWVDMGLPSGRKWALRNIGAKCEEDCGLLMDFDTANAIQFEDGWHLPTKEDFIELDGNCTHKWTVINGTPGMLFTSIHNGNSIFMPAAGFSHFTDGAAGVTLYDRGSNGPYWSSSFDSSTDAYNLLFGSAGVNPQDDSYRRYGFTVRAVQ